MPSGGTRFNHLEKLKIDRLAKIDERAVDRFKALLRRQGIAESTIRTYLKHLQVALRWAERKKMLARVPEIELPKRARQKSQMKGRPITGEEFERMLAMVPKVRPQDAEVWEQYLQGLWLSGLRLRESVDLSWDEDSGMAVDLFGKRPRFRILAESQKSHRDELLPMTPDFAEWLLQTPVEERYGRVFDLRVKADAAGRIVSAIGKAAKVQVAKGKHATAHDLRRSFGTRWSARVKPAYLQKLMRHADIKTTMDFYVSHDADEIAESLWSQHVGGNTLGNSHPNLAQHREPLDDVTPSGS